MGPTGLLPEWPQWVSGSTSWNCGVRGPENHEAHSLNFNGVGATEQSSVTLSLGSCQDDQ